MKGYALYQKGKDRLIKVSLENDQGHFVDVLVFATKKDLKDSADIEGDEEMRMVDV